MPPAPSRGCSPCCRCTTGSPRPTINIDDFDPAIDLDVVRGEHRTLPDGDIAALNNSFGFGGHNVALVFTNA